jgi:4-aminobutyrate aminotransferase-like enzyme
VGGYLFQQLEKLCQEYSLLGPPHGAGLLLGVDVIKDDGSPDPAQAKRIMNHMREHGVLIGTTGQYQNTLKIRPPIVFEMEHAELLLSALKSALDELQPSDS